MLSEYIIYQMKNIVKTTQKNCLLLLDDGSTYIGQGYGVFGDFIGEMCFNTSITGYQEILTDPSYFNQIINFTFPHIGIVGTNDIDIESNSIHAAGCVINNPISKPSNFRSQKSFDNWLKINKKVCISRIDTRNITKKIRDYGSCNALIHFPKEKFQNISILMKKLKSFPTMDKVDLASRVSNSYPYEWRNNSINKIDPSKYNTGFIAVVDFGIKRNILMLLNSKKYKTIVFPANYPTDKLLSLKPSGIFLSNGPGDPVATYRKYKHNLDLIKQYKKPVFGICLGHQILSLIYNAKTEKMHHGHRGANHPVKNIYSNKVEITVQNHGFVVSKKQFPKSLKITHISLFDQSIAGIEVKNKPFFSVQYHPESSPGPQDSRYLFKKFENLVEKYA